jgi:hypothetical protein
MDVTAVSLAIKFTDKHKNVAIVGQWMAPILLLSFHNNLAKKEETDK